MLYLGLDHAQIMLTWCITLTLTKRSIYSLHFVIGNGIARYYPIDKPFVYILVFDRYNIVFSI